MRIYRRIKRSTRQYIIVALICIVVIGSAAAFTSFIITEQIKDEYQALLNMAYQDMEANQRSVFIAATNISAGDVILKEMVEKKTVYASQPMETYITQKDIGRTALIDIPAGSQLMNAMLTDNNISDELREAEYQVININSNIVDRDTVDVRLCYPNGESYVVLSKKILRGYTAETATCYFWNDEAEILRMSAAIVDASLYQGSKLITTKYIEPSIQEASEINYTPSIQVLSLIENDPNIVGRCSQELNKTIRKSLENRLAESLNIDISSTDWNVSNYEFQSSGNLVLDNPEGKKTNILPTVTPLPGELGASGTGEENSELGVSGSGKDDVELGTSGTDTENAELGTLDTGTEAAELGASGTDKEAAELESSGTDSENLEFGASDTEIDNAELGAAQTDYYLYYAKEGEVGYGN